MPQTQLLNTACFPCLAVKGKIRVSTVLEFFPCAFKRRELWHGHFRQRLDSQQNTSLVSKHLPTEHLGFELTENSSRAGSVLQLLFFFPAANLTACSFHWHKTFSRCLSQLAFHLKIRGNTTSYPNYETTAFYDHQPFRHSSLLCSTTWCCFLSLWVLFLPLQPLLFSLTYKPQELSYVNKCTWPSQKKKK